MTKPQTTSEDLEELKRLAESGGFRTNIFFRALHDCREYHKLVREDNDVEIDPKWLESIGAVKDDHPAKWHFDRKDALSAGLWRVDDGWKAVLIYAEHAASTIVRGLILRGDVRRLASALGIELKEPV